MHSGELTLIFFNPYHIGNSFKVFSVSKPAELKIILPTHYSANKNLCCFLNKANITSHFILFGSFWYL
jgi:hypothetical protein